MNFDFTSWPTGAVAVFVASCITGGVAIVNIVVTFVDGNFSRAKINELVRREQWWTRWSWTIEKSLSNDPSDRFTGAAMMDALVERPWLTEDDRAMALAIAKAIVRRREEADRAAKNTPRGIAKTAVQAAAHRFRPAPPTPATDAPAPGTENA